MKTRLSVGLLVLTLLLTPALAVAQAAAPVTLSIKAGLDGYYRIGRWLPVRITVENTGPNIDGRVEINVPRVNNGKVIYAYPLSLPTQSRKEITLNLFPETYISRLQVALIDNSGHVILSQDQNLKSLSDADRLYGVIADQPSAFDMLGEIEPSGGAARVAQLAVQQLPDRAVALDALDTLIISNVDTGGLSEVQRTALATWIAHGGRLIVTGGAGWQKTSAGLRDLLPVQPESTTTLDNASALKSFVNAATDPGSTLVSIGALAPNAQPVVSQAETTLIARREHGFGEIYFLSFDPVALKHWPDLSAVYGRLVATQQERPNWSDGIQDWSTASIAASTLPNLDLPPTSLICGFLGIYMVLIGPVNYVIVRTLKRRELAWLTVPGLAIIFIAVAFLIGSITRGSQPVLNRLAVAEVWPAAGRARVSGIVGLYAPQRATHHSKADQGLLLNPVTDPNSYGSSVDTSDWTVTNDAEAQRVRTDLDVSQLKILSAQGAIPAPAFAPEVQLIVDDRGAHVEGTVTNRSTITLQNAMVLGAGVAQQIGTLQPGDRIAVNFQLDHAARSSQMTDVGAYYGNVDSTFEDIMGTTYYGGPFYFGGGDATQARRSNLLRSLLYVNYGTASRQGRGSGTYLVGWSDQSPLKMDLDGAAFGAYDTTLYIIDLNPTLVVKADRLTLPPGVFVWQLESYDGAPFNPYNMSYFQGQYTVRFQLAQPVKYRTVQDLALNLAGSQASPQVLTLAAWNYRTKDWTPVSHPVWGANAIADPADHVGPGGEVRLKIDAPSTSRLDLSRFDVTLTVQ